MTQSADASTAATDDDRCDAATTDHRAHPECYRVARGEQGVLMVEPYKSEILPHWRFRTPAIAQESADRIFEMFEQYRADDDFVGMDMARKFLQMGFTRARRYANHPSGRKYDTETDEKLPQAADWKTSEKAEAARIFDAVYERAKTDADYVARKRAHQKKYG